MRSMSKVVILLSTLAVLSGCSATTLRCGIDGESSFVELYNFPQDITPQTRSFKDLCGFAYESPQEPVARLNIIDGVD